MTNKFTYKYPEKEEERIIAAYARRKDGNLYSWFNPGYLFSIQSRERKFLRLLEKHGYLFLDTKKVLEIGCGTGYWLREFMKWGARPENLFGIDLISDRISRGKQLCPEKINMKYGNAGQLEFQGGAFDIVFQSTVFTSILDRKMKAQIAAEMLRVLKADGTIFWYDYHMNNPRNSDVRGVKKEEIYRLFPNCEVDLKKITLAPPLVRLVAPHSWLCCFLLEKIPFLCTHYLGVIRKI